MKTTNTILGMAAALALSTGSISFAQIGGNSPEETTPPVPSQRDRANTDNANDRGARDAENRDTQDRAGQNPAAADGNRGTTGQPGNHSGMNPAGNAGVQRDARTDSDQRTAAGARMEAAGQGDSMSQQLQAIQASPEKANQKLFILQQGAMNQWEIEFSDAVASKTQDPQVRELAEMTKRDHQKSQERLREVAQKHDITLSQQLPATKQQKLAILRQMPAEKLDKCFLVMQKSGHAAAITSLSDHQQMFTEADDKELKAYVDEALPAVKQHANRIVEVAQAKGIEGDITTIASTGNNAEAGTTAGSGVAPMPPKARDGALRTTPGDQMTGEQRE